jgi:hypothetical protein
MIKILYPLLYGVLYKLVDNSNDRHGENIYYLNLVMMSTTLFCIITGYYINLIILIGWLHLLGYIAYIFGIDMGSRDTIWPLVLCITVPTMASRLDIATFAVMKMSISEILFSLVSIILPLCLDSLLGVTEEFSDKKLRLRVLTGASACVSLYLLMNNTFCMSSSYVRVVTDYTVFIIGYMVISVVDIWVCINVGKGVRHVAT